MRCLALVGALWFWAASSTAMAQVEVSTQMERSTFLLYERVDLLVGITNTGDTDLILNNDEGHPWLSFLVAKKNRLPVAPERVGNFPGLTLKSGETKTLRVNLTPLFSFREQGDYKASAVIDLPGNGQIVSEGVPFSVLSGRVVWTQQRTVEGSQRTYSLLRFSPAIDNTKLYLRVEAPDENLVYTNIALGDMVSYVDPGVLFDPQGNLHILHPVALSTYLYTRVDPDGKILDQRIFKSTPFNDGTGVQNAPPRLTKLDDGNVFVSGGLEEDLNKPREKLSDPQNIKTAPLGASPK